MEVVQFAMIEDITIKKETRRNITNEREVQQHYCQYELGLRSRSKRKDHYV
jgi:hypothetical protein